MGGAARQVVKNPEVSTQVGGAFGGLPGAAAGFLGAGGQLGPAGAILDPADILGQRREQQRKEFEKQQQQDIARRKQEIEDLFGDAGKKAPTAIENVPSVQANQIASNAALQTSLARAGSDVDFLRGFSRTQGPTQQAQFLLEQQQLQQQGNLESLSQEQAQRQQQALESLAQRGGAGAGARERLAATGATGALRSAQEERRAGALARLGILSEDEARKLGVATKLPGAELGVTSENRAILSQDQQAALDAARANQQARLKENLANFQQQQALFQTRVGLLGAQQLAEQQRAAAAQQERIGPFGAGGGFLGLPTLSSITG